MLFNEPKLLKFCLVVRKNVTFGSFSALQRAEIAEIGLVVKPLACSRKVSVLFNEPKLLKSSPTNVRIVNNLGFSALQRAEIAEIVNYFLNTLDKISFSALQRAEIAEMPRCE